MRDVYRTNEGAYLEFYPQELKDYNAANKTTVKGLMVRYAAAATAHAADFDPSFVTLFQNFPTAFVGAQDNQSTEMEDVGTGRAIISSQRQALNISLYQAVHFVAYYVLGNIEAMLGLFRFNLLFAYGHSAPHERYHGDLLPNTTVVVIHDTFPEGTKIKVRNFGTTDLMIGTKTDDDPTGLVWKTLKPGKTKTYTKDTLFSHPDDTYLMVHNPDLNDHLPYQIERWVED
ncbi:MAG: hypothetical protein IPP77_00035 [Bacteroidetes bacterium]|nr:hypothetical protein [Bacteroidota bacterium]